MNSSQKLTGTDVKRLNKNRIFRLIYNNDRIARQDIADRLALSLPTVNQNLKLLRDEGLIECEGNFGSTGGRRAQAITVNNYAKIAISVNIKPDRYDVYVVDLKGQILYNSVISKQFDETDFYIESIVLSVKCALVYDHRYGADNVLGIGVTVSGILDEESNMLISAPPLGVKNYDLRRLMSAFGYPCRIMNDARAEAFADNWFNETDTNEKMYIMLGDGVGGAYIENSSIKRGIHNRCGELGHMVIHPDGNKCTCGKCGCFEAYVSQRKLSTEQGVTLEDFFNIIESGKPGEQKSRFMKVFDTYIDDLVLGINNIYTMLDCDIVLGGSVAPYLKKYENVIKEKLVNNYSFDTDASFLKIAGCSDRQTDLGAALTYIAEFVQQV